MHQLTQLADDLNRHRMTHRPPAPETAPAGVMRGRRTAWRMGRATRQARRLRVRPQA
jgi:hypothetical protein